MPTRNVSLTDHFDKFVERSVSSGQYLNASEVVREGLQLLEQKTREDRLKLERLREAADAGFSAIDQGQFREIRGSDVGPTVAAIGRRAANRARACDLDALIGGITDENRHAEIDFGEAVGNEMP
ncbi:MAG: type II toxin-antitoxin system ParD family antitoxin [Rhizomicrobium sp.]